MQNDITSRWLDTLIGWRQKMRIMIVEFASQKMKEGSRLQNRGEVRVCVFAILYDFHAFVGDRTVYPTGQGATRRSMSGRFGAAARDFCCNIFLPLFFPDYAKTRERG